MTRKAYQARKLRGRRKGNIDYPFYPNHVLRGLIVVAAALAVVAFLAAIFPPSLNQPADPLTGPDPGIQALWVLKPAIVLEKLFRSRVVTSFAIAMLFVLFLMFPVLDRTGQRPLRKRILVTVPFAALIAWLVLSILLSLGNMV